jgi:hypothetical protein
MNQPFQRTQVEARAKIWDPANSLPAAAGNSDAIPLLAHKDTGRLLVDVEGTITPTGIENRLDTLTGIEATEAADIATIKAKVSSLAGMEIPAHNYISCSYTGSNLTGVVYKTGGASGTTVATLTLGYDGSGNLTSVTKS